MSEARASAETEIMDTNVTSTSAQGSPGGANHQGNTRGQPIHRAPRGLKGLDKYKRHFTKKFYMKTYANDWTIQADAQGANIIGFMNVIPYEALCMYISPDEYLCLIRDNHYCKIADTGFEMRLKAVRTPFDANATDMAEANGNLNFEVKRFDGLETLLPFNRVDHDFGASTYNVRKSYAELITRLYGRGGLAHIATGSTFTGQLPATMRERGLSYFPVWRFNNLQNAVPTNVDNPTTHDNYTPYIPLSSMIASLPVGEFETDSINTGMIRATEGYCFNKEYKPKNGIIMMAPSAWEASDPYNTAAGPRSIFINQPVLEKYNPGGGNLGGEIESTWSAQFYSLYPSIVGGATVNVVKSSSRATNEANPDGNTSISCPALNEAIPNPRHTLAQYFATGNPDPPTADVVTSVSLNPQFHGYGYAQHMRYYTIANIENYTCWTSRNQNPLHHMTSMAIGAIPKTNKNETIVNATFEWEITTSCTVECETSHVTYINNALNIYANDGALNFNGAEQPANTIMDGSGLNLEDYGALNFNHNETDVGLAYPKSWTGSYGIAAKPNFVDIDTTILDPLRK